MRLDVFQSPDDFLRATRDELAKNEALNNLMLGVALRILKVPERFKHQPFYAVVTDELGVAAAALMTPPQNLQLYGARDEMESAVEMIAGELRRGGWVVPGVVGPARVSRLFAEAWMRAAGRSGRLSMAHGLFELRKVDAPRWPPGRLRPAVAADLELLTGWFCAFQEEALFNPADPRQMQEVVELRIGDGDVFVWEDTDDQPASMALRTRPTLSGISIGSVYTPPELRGRGYASACVAALSQLCLDSGYRFCTLYTDLANPTSNSIYQKIGYRPIGDSCEYRFGNTNV